MQERRIPKRIRDNDLDPKERELKNSNMFIQKWANFKEIRRKKKTTPPTRYTSQLKSEKQIVKKFKVKQN